MRDSGLSEAIRAAGGISELARQIGISQPSVSNWVRVPAERVISVESVTGVDRTVLRPDLYSEKKIGRDIDELDGARTQEYALPAPLLMRTQDAELVSRNSKLRATDPSSLGQHDGLAEAPNKTNNGRKEQKMNAPPTGRMRIIGLAGWSGSGKTTLVTKLIPRLIARGLKVSTLKHAHHGFDLDQPGKDSFFHRAAGATEVIISSAKRWAVLHELRDEREWNLHALVAKMSPVDLVLVEGFKRDAFPKLEIHRAENNKPLIHPHDPHVIAIASDIMLPQAKVPVVHLDDIEVIADLLLRHAVPISVAASRSG